MAIVASDALAWWDFQDGSGTTVVDKITVSPTNLTLFNTPSWVTGGPTNLPNGVDFNGTTQYAQAAKDYDYASGEGTVSVWVNSDNVSSLRTITDDSNLGGEHSLFFNTGNNLLSRSRFGGVDRDISTSVSTSTLYHIVYAFKSGDMQLYVNNVSVGTNTGTGVLSDTGSNFTIARRAVTSAAFLDGRIFQVVVLNRRITTAEVGELWNSGAGVTYDQLFSAAPTPRRLMMMGVGM